MDLSAYWSALLLGGPISVGLFVSFLIASFCSLVLEGSLLKTWKKTGSVLLSLAGFTALFVVILGIATIVALSSMPDRNQAFIAGMVGMGILFRFFWVFLMVEIFLLVWKAYRHKS
jgi:hypothetical protein